MTGPAPASTDQGCKTFTYDGTTGSVDLVKSWTGLVPGDYTVTETGAVGGLTKWTVDVSGSPATVPTDGGKATAGVKNTRKLGSLEVTKTVDWNGVDRRLMGRSSRSA